MAEFKKLSDVEVVAEPMESANVLIEENGVIKKAPKTAVGGNGVFDAKIYINGGDSVENAGEISLIAGNYMTLAEKLINKEMPMISICWYKDFGGYFYEFCTFSRFSVLIEGTIQILFMDPGLNPRTLMLLPDNTFGSEPV